MVDVKKVVLNKSTKQSQSGRYPVLEMGKYFPGGVSADSHGLSYDYVTGIEKNFTSGMDRVNISKAEYDEIRKKIESLPQMKGFELRAFRAITYDDIGTVISFAIAHRGSHSLLPMSPFCLAYYYDYKCASRHPYDVVNVLTARGVQFINGRKIALGDYILRKHESR